MCSMLQYGVRSLVKPINLPMQFRNLRTTNVLPLIQKWRKERGLPLNPNACGVLVESPDYTMLNGRLTPYGTRHKKRILKQRETLQQILTLTKEVDFAVERHEQLQTESENRRNELLRNKLKPKGLQYLKQK